MGDQELGTVGRRNSEFDNPAYIIYNEKNDFNR